GSEKEPMIYCRDIFGSGPHEDSIDESAQTIRLIALEINFTSRIDYGFSTIFMNEGVSSDTRLTEDELRDIITQAKALGVRKVLFSGKDVSSYALINKLTSFARSLDIEANVIKDEYLCIAAFGNNDPSFCMRHIFSCVVTSYGYVLPCPGLEIPIGNIRGQKLSDIIKDSEILADLKDHVNRIKGPCRICENTEGCCGCRGRAYNATGDYLASDPTCIKNKGMGRKTLSLPVPAEDVIPQKQPMRIIDTLDRLAERSASCSVLIKKDMPFINDDLSVDNVAYLEMIAQSIAALNGFRNMNESGSSPEGYLLGAKNLEIFGRAGKGDRLSIMVFKYARYGGFGIVRGVVSKNNELIAKGEIKVWHKTVED
ncbi:MAG: SPASM domain-containing protein, partial [Nitrospirae bacterium]|nr:SPASM domain-containing protein [Nitrospirota bacterium]